MKETVGAKRDGVTRKVPPRRSSGSGSAASSGRGYRRPRPLTFGEYAETWFEAGKRSQGWKPATVPGVPERTERLSRAVDRLDPSRLGDWPGDVSAFVTDAMTRKHGNTSGSSPGCS